MLCLALSLLEVRSITNDFNATIAAGAPTLVKFYAPWCGHCRELAPKYEALSELMAGTQFVIAEVDCTVNGALCTEQGVKGYPTLKFYNKGEAVDQYKGPREADALKKWLEEKLKQ